jgi:CheY-like chemotaxis protein
VTPTDASSTERRHAEGTILLVDDEPSLRRLVARWLTRAGFEVLQADDGVAAVDLARRHRLDAVVSDVRMPRMGGLELLELLLELDSRLPILLMSGSDEIADAQMAQQLGASDFLAKPLNLTQLQSAVERMIAARRGDSVAERANGTKRVRQGTILVVDDYDDARGALRDALEDAGHVVVEAANGQQALDYLISHREPAIGLITLDLMMPVMDGFKFLDVLHSYVRLSTIPVLIVSSQSQKIRPDVHSAIVGQVQTPFPLNDLIKMVNECVTPATAGG